MFLCFMDSGVSMSHLQSSPFPALILSTFHSFVFVYYDNYDELFLIRLDAIQSLRAALHNAFVLHLVIANYYDLQLRH